MKTILEPDSSLSNWKDNQTKTQCNTDDLNNIMNHPDLYVVSFLLLLGEQLSKLFNGLKQFVILPFRDQSPKWALMGQNQGVSKAAFPEALGRERFLLQTFQVSQRFSSLSLVSSQHLQSQQLRLLSNLAHQIALFSCLTLPSLL